MGAMEMVLGILFFIFLFGLFISYRLISQYKNNPEKNSEKDKDFLANTSLIQGWLKFLVIFVPIVFFTYRAVEGTPMQGHLQEWMDLIVRWFHITFGIAWIGASFYFVFLENSIHREGKREGIAGDLWAVHGGGFYFVEKYLVAPPKIPKNLHWFKFEAYFTWLTGTALLTIVYYFNAESFLLNPEVEYLTPVLGVLLGVSSIVVSWFFYSFLCSTSLLAPEKRPIFFLIMFVYLLAVAYLLTYFFNPRAAYIHLGAIMGTMMAGNVYYVIIPSQKEMVFAAKEGREFNKEIGKLAGWRSYHNNYFTMPVLFIMISNHFPSTFGNEYNWLVLAMIGLAGAGIKHFHNLWERHELNRWVIPVSVVLLLLAIWVTAPAPPANIENEAKVPFSEISSIMRKRCQPCHSIQTTDDVFTVAQQGVMFDTPQQIADMKDRIMNRVVTLKSMPLANKTKMTDEERKTVEIWILQGGNID